MVEGLIGKYAVELIIGTIVLLFGANYKRRGNKIKKLKTENDAYEKKDEAHKAVNSIGETGKDKIKEIRDDAKKNNVTDELNNDFK